MISLKYVYHIQSRPIAQKERTWWDDVELLIRHSQHSVLYKLL